MVVTYNEVNAFLLGICYLLNGLDAAVKHNNQLYACLIGVIHTLLRHSVTLVVAVRNVVVKVVIIPFKEVIDQRYGCGAVNVIITVNQNALATLYGAVDTCYRLVHVIHEPRVKQFVQLRVEKFLYFGLGFYAPLYQ